MDYSDISALLEKLKSYFSGSSELPKGKSSLPKLEEIGKPLGGNSQAISRAREWVAVKMPYCGGINGGNDIICGGKCIRKDNQKNPIWDKYRTDCSGLVSWAWGLKPPGHVCASLAPFATDVSYAITVDELAPGDACNSGKHIFLFVGWADTQGTARIIQARGCKHPTSEETVKFKKINDNTIMSPDGLKFHPIRCKSLGAAAGSHSKIDLVAQGCELYSQLTSKL